MLTQVKYVEQMCLESNQDVFKKREEDSSEVQKRKKKKNLSQASNH